MAIYHASTKSISRSAGRSAVASAAYRAGESLTDQRTGLIHDYTRRETGSIVSAQVILPDGGSADREQLWNAAEAAEKRKDARTAREWVIALPAELSAEQRKALAHDFAGQLAERYGVAVDVSIHRPDKHGDHRNHHAHLLTTTRQVLRGEADALEMGYKAPIELSDTKRRSLGLGPVAEEITALRAQWAETANRHLERAGQAERIDHRSLKAQGLERVPTTHLGPHVVQMERRGMPTDRGAQHRQRLALNAQIIELAEVRRQLAAAEADKTPEPEPLSPRHAFEAEAAEAFRQHVEAGINRWRAEWERQRDAEAQEQARTRDQSDPFAPPKSPETPPQGDPAILETWRKAEQAHFKAIVGRARKLQEKTHRQLDRHEKRIEAHRRTEPQKPQGLFAGLKKTAYYKAHAAWNHVRMGLENRYQQLLRRLSGLDDYLHRGLSGRPSAGEKLAAKKVEHDYPGLTQEYRQASQRERKERLAREFAEREKQERQEQSQGRGGRGR